MKSLVSCLSAVTLIGAIACATTTRRPALPAPTGTWMVDTHTFVWTDTARRDRFTSGATSREVLVHLWVPRSASRARSDSLALVVFSPGAGETALSYSALLVDLASHGYVVAGIGHLFDTPTLTLPNGRVVQPARPDSGANLFAFTRALIESRAADLLFVGRRLIGMDMSTVFASGRISPRRVAVIGHSRGGVAALEACKRDAMFRACINLDGGVVGGPYYPDPDSLAPRAPTLWFQAFHPPPSDAQLAGLRLSRAQWDSFDLRANHLIARARGGGWRITLPDTSHYAFADAVLTAPAAGDAAHNAQTLATVRRITRAFLEATFAETSGDAIREAIEAARGVTGVQIRGDSDTGSGNGRVPYRTSNSFRRGSKDVPRISCSADHLPRSCSWRRDGTLSLGKDR